VCTLNIVIIRTQHDAQVCIKVDLCNGEVKCFLCGTDRILKYFLDEFLLQRVKEYYYFARPALRREHFTCENCQSVIFQLRVSDHKLYSRLPSADVVRISSFMHNESVNLILNE
jgi:hypothetical protein